MNPLTDILNSSQQMRKNNFLWSTQPLEVSSSDQRHSSDAFWRASLLTSTVDCSLSYISSGINEPRWKFMPSVDTKPWSSKEFKMETEKLFADNQKGRTTSKEKILVTLSVIGVVVSVALLISLIVVATKNDPKTSDIDDICLTQACIVESANVLSMMNLSADPYDSTNLSSLVEFFSYFGYFQLRQLLWICLWIVSECECFRCHDSPITALFTGNDHLRRSGNGFTIQSYRKNTGRTIASHHRWANSTKWDCAFPKRQATLSSLRQHQHDWFTWSHASQRCYRQNGWLAGCNGRFMGFVGDVDMAGGDEGFETKRILIRLHLLVRSYNRQ